MVDVDPLKVDIDPVFTGDNEVAPQAPSGAYDLLNNQEYTPSRPTVSDPETALIRDISRPAIRTYKDDIQSAIQANHLSSVNIAMAENDRMRSQINPNIPTSSEEPATFSKSKIILFVSVLLIVVGVGAIGITSLITGSRSNPVANITPTSIITTEYKDELNIGTVAQGRFNSALASRINDVQIPVNSFYNVYITSGATSTRRLITAQEFAVQASLQISDTLKRNLTSEFMAGMYSFGQNMPFIIFKTNSFEITFAGMIDWEKSMERDFSVLFRLNGANGVGSLAQALTPTIVRKFEDKVVINKDVRILRDAEGKTSLLYGIVDKNTVVITTTENAFKEIVSRLNKEKGLKR